MRINLIHKTAYLPGILNELGPERLLFVDKGWTAIDGMHRRPDPKNPSDHRCKSSCSVISHWIVVLLFYLFSV